MNINISVDAVALYTAIAATVGVIVSIYAIRRDRPRLKVIVRSQVTIEALIDLGVDAQGASRNAGCTIIEVTNVGRHPISLESHPKYKYNGSQRECSLAWRPQSDLPVGEKSVVIIGQNVDLSQLTDVVVKDATGRAWKYKANRGFRMQWILTVVGYFFAVARHLFAVVFRRRGRPMEKREARALLTEKLAEYRKLSYSDLVAKMSQQDCYEVIGPSGIQYQIEVQFFWDDKPGKDVRVAGSIDGGRISALFPVCNSFIKAIDGRFVGENHA